MSANPTTSLRRSTRAACCFRWLSLVAVVLAATSVRAVVISEIHYNPANGEDGLEFVELTNDSTTSEDISGYRLNEGVFFEIPAGTVLGRYEVLVICADADLVRARYGITNAIGNFTGRLDGSGERLTLVDQVGIPVQSIRYRDEGKWPAAPDATGHSLVLLDVRLDSKEPESWTWSPQLGGSPGALNFSTTGPRFEDTVLIDRGAIWRFRRGTAAFSSPADAWRQPDFDDSAWESGPSGIGYGDNDDATTLTDMQNRYTTVAIRRRFTLSAQDLAAAGDFFLGVDFDDGFCAYVNGTEVAAVNCDSSLVHTSTATGSHEAGAEETFAVPRGALVAGENVLAVFGVNFSLGSSDFSLAPRFIRRLVVSDGAAGRPDIVFNELARGPAVAQRWVEIFNRGPGDVDLSGYTLTDDPTRPDPYVLPAASIVASRGFLVIDESASGLDFSTPEVRLYLRSPSGDVAAAESFDRLPPPELAGLPWSEPRFPDGGALDWVSATPTRGAANEVARTEDVVINEIFYQPPEDRRGEFIELYNRGAAAIDLEGFRFDKGVQYTFEPGVTIGPGEYLVLSEDPEHVESVYGISEVLGPYTGVLADAGENLRLVDRWGNPVDEVRYHDGGKWSEWADGAGSSLEFIDPFQDNSVASAWEASDEDGKAAWEELSYSVPAYVPAVESELHLFLVEKGRCLIDDVSIRRGGGANHISNPGFETSTAPWRIEGTHIGSRRVTWDRHSGTACLELTASGKGDTTVNRIETDTSPAMTSGAYEVRLWARWLRGASVIVAHSEFTAGPWGGRPGPAENLSGNTLGGRLRMTVPTNLGTPGAENSVRRNLRAATGRDNLGPVISEVLHEPASPPPSAVISVRARASDSDGVASVRVYYRTGDASGAFSAADLRDDGRDGDRLADDGLYFGRINGYAGGTKVVFYIEAADALGGVRRFPPDAPSRTLLLQVQGPVSPGLDTARWILDDARTSELGSRLLHSNDLLDGTFVYNDDQVYYNVGVRYRGSPWGRPGRNNFRIDFPEDNRFLRGRSAVNLTSRGGSATEKAVYFLVGRNGSVEKPAPTSDYFFVRAYFNGGSLGIQGLYQPVDRDYAEKWYGPLADGPVLKANGRLLFDDAGNRRAWDGASHIYMAGQSENYRSYFYHAVNQSRDDWSGFAALTRVMDRGQTSNTEFDTAIDGVLDVEAWMRVMSVRILAAGWDDFGIGNGHNGYLAFNPVTGLWGALPFDLDNSLGDANFPLFPSADGDVARMMARPGPRRVYFRVLAEVLDGYWSRQESDPFWIALQRDTGIASSGVQGFLTTRASVVRPQIASSLSVPFRILTNGGADMVVDATSVELEGDAPVNVARILVDRGDGETGELAPRWTTPTRWRAQFELFEDETEFQFIGFDGSGEIVATTAIGVTSAVLSKDVAVSTWFPNSGPVEGGFEVSFVGRNFAEGLRIFFGAAESPSVSVDSARSVRAIAPRAVPPLPADGLVDIRVVLDGSPEIVLARAFQYTGSLPDVFTRGDGNRDFVVDISDPVQTVFHLFLGRPLGCPDAADFNDDGELRLNDAIALLDFIFRAGPGPAPPFPAGGLDPTSDSLRCEESP